MCFDVVKSYLCRLLLASSRKWASIYDFRPFKLKVNVWNCCCHFEFVLNHTTYETSPRLKTKIWPRVKSRTDVRDLSISLNLKQCSQWTANDALMWLFTPRSTVGTDLITLQEVPIRRNFRKVSFRQVYIVLKLVRWRVSHNSTSVEGVTRMIHIVVYLIFLLNRNNDNLGNWETNSLSHDRRMIGIYILE